MTGPRTVFALTLRAALGRRRALALLVLALVPAAIAVADLLVVDEADRKARLLGRILSRLVLPTVIALIALVIAAGAIGDEREDGTILYLVATPVSRLRLVLDIAGAAWAATLLLLLPALIATLVVANDVGSSAAGLVWLVVAFVVVSGCYCALFALFGVATRRPVVAGLLYILFWEGSIASFAPSADRLSIAAYGRRLVEEALTGNVPQVPDVPLAAAALVPAIAAAAFMWLAGRRLSRVELP